MWLALLLSLTLSVSDPSQLTAHHAHAEERVWTVEEMKDLATEKAKAYGLNVDRFLKTITCESQWDRFAVGDNGLSHGLAQFYHPTRDWNIATSSAYEPEIALELMAKTFEKGEAYRWTCWRLLSSSSPYTKSK